MAQTSSQPDVWLDAHEVAERYKLSTDYLKKLAQRGEGPPFLEVSDKGRKRRYREADLQAWVETQMKGAKR